MKAFNLVILCTTMSTAHCFNFENVTVNVPRMLGPADFQSNDQMPNPNLPMPWNIYQFPFNAMPMIPMPPTPMVVPARTYFEPVIHHHPPPDIMKNILKRKRRKYKKRLIKYTSSESSDTSMGTDSEDIDYYGDFMHVRG